MEQPLDKPAGNSPKFQSSMRSSSLGNKRAMYATSNQEYGEAWMHQNVRPETLNIKYAVVPTYSEVVDAATDFKNTQRLIKSKILQEQYLSSQEFGQTNSSLSSVGKSTVREFPVRYDQYKYPSHGMKVGSLIYKTSNMSYGDNSPSEFQIPIKYLPCDSAFTKGFNGGNARFNGLNTAKTISKVHNVLNQL